MFVIDGPMWFVVALLICGWHTYYLWDWRRERWQYQEWWKKHDADAQQRHDEFMRVMGSDDVEESEMKEMP